MARISETLLDVRNLSCSLDRDTPLLHDVSFGVRQGDILILQGKSGCGYASNREMTLPLRLTAIGSIL